MDPYMERQERRAMKEMRDYSNKLQAIADAQYGIPTTCPCGGRIVDEVAAGEIRDWLPGKKYFTCIDYKNDGLHFRQPWVTGVEEELRQLTRQAKESDKLAHRVHELTYELKNLKVMVEKLTMRLAELEMAM